MALKPLDPTLEEDEDLLMVDESTPLKALPQTDPATLPTPEEEANVFADMAMGVVRGTEGAVRSVYNLADFVTGDALPNWEKNFTGTSQTTAGSIVENTTEFLVGFVPVFGWLGKASKLGTVARGAVAGAVADFAVFDGTEDRLSNLIQSVPELRNPITEFLARDEDDSAIEGRFKNALEGLGLGALTDTLAASLRGVAKARKLKASGASAEEVNKTLVEGIGDQEKLEETLTSLKKTDAPASSPKASPELDKLATDLFNGLSPTDSSKYIDTEDDLRALFSALREKELARQGTRPPRPIKEEFEAAGRVLSGFSGKDEQAVFAALRASAASIEDATANALAAGRLMQGLAEDAQRWAKLVTDGAKTEENILKSLQAQERLAAAINIFEGFGTAQGRALNARKFLKSSELKSKQIARELVEKLGGTDRLSSQLEKIAAADSAEGVGRLVSNQLTFGGRLFRAHNEYWMNAILSGPKTSVVNTLGNTFTTLYLPLEGMVGGLLRGDTGAAKSFLKQYVYLAEAASESMRWAFKAFKSGESVLESGGRFMDEAFGSKKIDAGYLANKPELSSQGLGAEAKALLVGDDAPAMAHLINFAGEVTRMPQRFLTGTDEFFKQLNYRAAAKSRLYFEARKLGLEGETLAKHVADEFDKIITKGGQRYSEAAVYRQAIAEAEAKGLQDAEKDSFVDAYVEKNFNPERSALSEFATGVAKEATFQRDLDGLPKKLQEAVQAHPALQLVVPFVKTPTNILRFVGQRTFAFTKLPGGYDFPILSSLHKRMVQDMASADPLIRAQAAGRAVMGQALFSAAGLLAFQGKITGKGPRNEDERKALMATGWQPYSFKFGDTYVSYQRMDPAATFFGLVADWFEQAVRQDRAKTDVLHAVMNSAAIALAANVTNKSYLTGIQQITDALSNPERYADKFAKSRLGSYVPNLVAQIRGDLDGDQALKEVRTYSDVLMGRLPFTQGYLEPKRNILGQSVDSVLATTPFSAVNPFTVSPTKNDKVFEELAKLQHGFRAPSTAYQGVINLLDIRSEKGQTAYDRWLELHGEVKLGGRTLRQSLEKLFSSSRYQKMADQSAAEEFRSPRVAEVERVLGMYRRAAFAQTQREYPELKQAIVAVNRDKIALRRGQAAQQLASLLNR